MPPEEKESFLKNPVVKVFFWVALLCVVCVSAIWAFPMASERLAVTYTDFKTRVSEGAISDVLIKGDRVYGRFKEPVKVSGEGGTTSFKELETTLPSIPDPELLSLLESSTWASVLRERAIPSFPPP